MKGINKKITVQIYDWSGWNGPEVADDAAVFLPLDTQAPRMDSQNLQFL